MRKLTVACAISPSLRTGLRVLQLTGRRKDGCAVERKIFRVSHDEEKFAVLYNELLDLMQPNERIYVSAAPRDLAAAGRKFEEAQLASRYDGDPTWFYRRLERNWISALMKSPAEKVWMFDIDTDRQDTQVTAWLRNMTLKHKGFYTGKVLSRYQTKNGEHVLLRPFDVSLMPGELAPLLHKDPLALLCYWEPETET